MTSEALSLLRIARRLGRDPRLVQGGGGNVSQKQGGEMLVKASGTALKQVTAEDFVRLDYVRLRGALYGGGLADDAAYRRELAACRRGPGRPSIESTLHALLGPTVLHSHPNAVLRLLCRQDARAQIKRLKAALGVAFLFIGYAGPGLPLAAALMAEAQRTGTDLAATPLLVFLANHGLFVSARDAREAAALHSRVLALCAQACPFPSYPAPLPPADEALRQRLAAWARTHGCWHAPRRAAVKAAVSLFSQSPENELGACFPDQVVYLGPAPLRLETNEAVAWERAWNAYLARWRQAPLLISHSAGCLLFSFAGCTLNAAREESLATFCEVLCGQSGFLSRLSAAQCRHLMNWESERYRSAALADGARKSPRKES